MNTKSEEFKQRIIKFVVNISNELNKLAKNQTNLIFTKQIIRSASSIGANYQEAQNAHSKKEFIQKLSISLKEATETIYWIEIIEATNNLELNQTKQENTEILKILTSIVKSSKNVKS